MEAWRHGGMEGWRDGGMEGWRVIDDKKRGRRGMRDFMRGKRQKKEDQCNQICGGGVEGGESGRNLLQPTGHRSQGMSEHGSTMFSPAPSEAAEQPEVHLLSHPGKLDPAQTAVSSSNILSIAAITKSNQMFPACHDQDHDPSCFSSVTHLGTLIAREGVRIRTGGLWMCANSSNGTTSLRMSAAPCAKNIQGCNNICFLLRLRQTPSPSL
ncbi:unnamed protein product [Pleuronectes platessa]|uniref:Uncharacterized protein n=1 Tax=Pleuronectes platessa TaxID=8262 RepID=A0A9N7YNC4_PLEPL|nr:unnamed protein product [Pleuronectes platessa]